MNGRDILVEDERIVAVGSGLKVRSQVQVIDFRPYTVLPGLIDAHTHLLNVQKPQEGMVGKHLRQAREGTTYRASSGVERARSYLEAGFTTIRDLGNAGRFGDVALRDAIRDGAIEGPRMIVSGPGLVVEDGLYEALRRRDRETAEGEYVLVTDPKEHHPGGSGQRAPWGRSHKALRHSSERPHP